MIEPEDVGMFGDRRNPPTCECRRRCASAEADFIIALNIITRLRESTTRRLRKRDRIVAALIGSIVAAAIVRAFL